MPKNPNLRSVAHSGSYIINGSEELILPHGKITKTVEIADVHKNDTGA
jgi:hypothetical protein